MKTHVMTTFSKKKILKTHLYMILALNYCVVLNFKFNAKKLGFHLFFNGSQWQSTSYDISQFTPNSMLIEKSNNPTKINGSLMISQLFGDQQAQNLKRILGYQKFPKSSKRQTRYLTWLFND